MDRKIGILCAGDDELAPFLPLIENRTETRKAMLTIYEGEISGVPAAVLFSGVCKVNAAVAAQILIDSYGAQAIINAGTAGALEESLAPFDTAVGTETAYHDVAENFERNCRRASEISARLTAALLEVLRETES